MRRGRLLKAGAPVIVHQGNKFGGRTQHLRLGYSMVANYAYLLRKGTVRLSDTFTLIGRPVLGSLRGLVLGPDRAERLQRFRGMGLAVADILRGRIDPGRIERLNATAE